MRRTPPKSKTLSDENPFSLSLGDLMAGLLLIFVLLLSFLMLNLSEIVDFYIKLQSELYKDLEEEFKDDLKEWNAVLDQETLSVRFKGPRVRFIRGKAEIRQEFKNILDQFFPRYIKILRETKDIDGEAKYINNIAEIRIEGHTSSEWHAGVSAEEAYIHNMELSQARTRSVLKYVLQTSIGNNEAIPIEQRQKIKEWLKQPLTANGLSSSKLIFNPDGTENKEESRRVEFRVRIDAEKLLYNIIGGKP